MSLSEGQACEKAKGFLTSLVGEVFSGNVFFFLIFLFGKRRKTFLC